MPHLLPLVPPVPKERTLLNNLLFLVCGVFGFIMVMGTSLGVTFLVGGDYFIGAWCTLAGVCGGTMCVMIYRYLRPPATYDKP